MNKKAQFYFMATIVLIGLVAGLALTYNYSKKTNFYDVEQLAEELSIESEKVLDYDLVHSSNQFNNFAKDYSAYAGEDKEIYFITVNEGVKEAYKYTEGVKEDFSTYLSVQNNKIEFFIGEVLYTFPLEKGNNFYFVLSYEKNGEKYVFSG
jgi:hypothetical protein